MPKKQIIFIIIFIIATAPFSSRAQDASPTVDENLKTQDSDQDGLTDSDETNIYRTEPNKADTDGDGYKDGEEIQNSYDPNKAGDDKIGKVIGVHLADQTLTYSLGPYAIKTIKISSGLPRTPTPKGDFSIIIKKPVVHYRGIDYNFPNTKWNLMFKYGSWGNFYIHGAYWHNNFGRPQSHGCVNVSYADMEGLYNWAEEGTRVIIE